MEDGRIPMRNATLKRSGKVKSQSGRDTITFNIRKSMKSAHSHDDYLYCADHTIKLVKEQWVDTVYHDGGWTNTNEKCNLEEIREPMDASRPWTYAPPDLISALHYFPIIDLKLWSLDA
nr:hypothetical protein [Tanacetum cinerariifolium]